MTAAEFHAARASLGLNQTELAEALGISQAQVSQIETGKKKKGRVEMIITRDEAYQAIFDRKADAVGTVIDNGMTYTVINRYDEQRTDHVVECGGDDIFGDPAQTLYESAPAIIAKAQIMTAAN